MSATEISDLIAALRSGSTSLDEVARQFRHRTWARTRQPVPKSYLEQATAAQLDPAPDVAGSIDEVTAAYDRGELTQEQYQVLAGAAAESINAEYEAEDRGAETSTSE